MYHRMGRRALICALIGCVVSTPVEASATASEVERLMASLRRARNSLKSQDCIEETVITESRGGRVVSEQSHQNRIQFRADLARIVIESETAGKPATRLDGGKDLVCGPGRISRVIAQSTPSPDWLYRLPEILASSTCVVEAQGNGQLIIVTVRLPDGARRRLMEVELDRNDLPIRMTRFGNRQEVQDEAVMQWQKHQGYWFPSMTTHRQISVLNEITRKITYQEIRLNIPLASSLFEAP